MTKPSSMNDDAPSSLDPDGVAVVAQRRLLAEADATLASMRRDSGNRESNAVHASEWIERLLPLWREASRTDRDSGHQPDPYSAIDGGAVLKLIDGFLALMPARESRSVSITGRNAAIERAKREWEGTADALTSLVCLLNSGGVVLRANRVVEQWELGTVGGVIGQSAHAVLHPQCSATDCPMQRDLDEALLAMKAGGGEQAFEHYTPALDRTWQLTLRRMSHGQDSASGYGDAKGVLVVTDISALRRAQLLLEGINASLESRVQFRTKKLAEANRALRSEAERRRTAEQQLLISLEDRELLSKQLIQAQESERRRIAAELHDSVGQSLSAIKFTLERAVVMLQKPGLGDPEPVLALALQRIAETSEGIRAISRNLRPQMLDTMGAASATAWFCRDFAEIYGTLNLHAQISAANSDIPSRITIHVYRCVQELLNNVAKHAHAENVAVELRREANTLSLSVTDDGVGVSLDALHPARVMGSGLRNLRERAEMTGGRFLVSSPPSGGTTVEISWVLADADFDDRPAASPSRRSVS